MLPQILPRAVACVRVGLVGVSLETAPTITFDLGSGPALGGALVVSMYVQVVVKTGVVEVDLPIAERQAPGNDSVGNLVEEGERENLTIVADELTEHPIVVLGIHPPEKGEEDNVLVTALLEP